MTFFFEPEHFIDHLITARPGYADAEPFPHAVIDDFLPDNVAQTLLADFPGPGFEYFKQPDNAYQVNKLGRVQEYNFRGLSPYLRQVLQEFNGRAFLEFLQELTGIEGLIPDPHFFGGALHQILNRGKLAVHADFNKDVRRNLDRRLNVLIYFNKDWQDSYGGHLELWTKDMQNRVSRIAPVFNRCVLFTTSAYSFHGHPDPLDVPEGVTRKSIALYYYTSGRPHEERDEFVNTFWQTRPGEVIEAPIDAASADAVEPPLVQGLKPILKGLCPPFLWNLMRRLRSPASPAG